MNPARVTVLVTNTASGRGLLGEHGLSFWVEYAGKNILFDTGQTDIVTRNARILGIDLARSDAIVLSHGHYDHTGGLAKAIRIAPHARVFLHPDALRSKFSRRADGSVHNVGLSRLTEEDIRCHSGGLVLTTEPTEIVDGVFATGAIPRSNGFEDTGGAFFRDAACTEPDPLNDDQAVFFRCAKGTVVLLGCAHAGVINTLDYVVVITGRRPLYAVIGGMHLGNASESRLAATLDAIRSHESLQLAPAHCTGTGPTALLWHRFPGRCRECVVGSQFEFDCM